MLKKESEFLKCPNDRICLTSVLLQIVMIKFIKNRTFVYHEDFLSLSHVSKNSNISNKFKALFSHRKIPTIYFHNNCKSGHVPTSNSIEMHVTTSLFPSLNLIKKRKKIPQSWNYACKSIHLHLSKYFHTHQAARPHPPPT